MCLISLIYKKDLMVRFFKINPAGKYDCVYTHSFMIIGFISPKKYVKNLK